MKKRTNDESKVSGTTIPRHFQCKKCPFDGLENETNNSRRFMPDTSPTPCGGSPAPSA